MNIWTWCTSRPRWRVHDVSCGITLFRHLVTPSDGLHLVAKTWRNMSGKSSEIWCLLMTSLHLSYVLVNIMSMTCWVFDLCTTATYSAILVTVILVAVWTQILTKFQTVLVVHVLQNSGSTTILASTLHGSVYTCEISSIMGAWRFTHFLGWTLDVAVGEEITAKSEFYDSKYPHQ